MKVRFFEIDTSHLPTTTPPAGNQMLHVPGLSAYAIDHADLMYNGIANPIDGVNFSIVGDAIEGINSQLEESDSLTATVYYIGIRDFALLFPNIKAVEPDRAERMGRFYEEAEKAFDVGAWLSFMLMCGSIFEHLLYFKIGSPAGIETLKKISDEALARGIINATQFAVIDNARRARNVIHCNRLPEAYITRIEAMDARVVIEKLMLQL